MCGMISICEGGARNTGVLWSVLCVRAIQHFVDSVHLCHEVIHERTIISGVDRGVDRCKGRGRSCCCRCGCGCGCRCGCGCGCRCGCCCCCCRCRCRCCCCCCCGCRCGCGWLSLSLSLSLSLLLLLLSVSVLLFFSSALDQRCCCKLVPKIHCTSITQSPNFR